ncbi:MAG: hypothetical protein LBC88_02925 [Spirochaetaceae bacterium]|jgi:hypothetical protein|nr:hypothetical protein [Spirochaetaceae bacterium]
MSGSPLNVTWIAAASFKAAALLLAQYRPKLLDVAGQSGPEGTALCVFPEFLSAAFACELYLKSLKKGLTGHNLRELFESLRDETKQDIVEKMIKTNERYGGGVFHAELAANAASFENWQSFYEDGTIAAFGIPFLTDFLNALQRFSVEHQAVREPAPDF